MKVFIYGVICVVLAAVIWGFFIVGSPKTERLRKFDERRISDLQSIQSEIINYWQQKNRLPETPDDLRDDIRGITIPKDPESSAPYEYKKSGEAKFFLCAIFDLPNVNRNVRSLNQVYSKPIALPAPGSYAGGITVSEIWDHEAGRICFDRQIDRELYKPISPKGN